jgi:hypothetical protein
MGCKSTIQKSGLVTAPQRLSVFTSNSVIARQKAEAIQSQVSMTGLDCRVAALLAMT